MMHSLLLHGGILVSETAPGLSIDPKLWEGLNLRAHPLRLTMHLLPLGSSAGKLGASTEWETPTVQFHRLLQLAMVLVPPSPASSTSDSFLRWSMPIIPSGNDRRFLIAYICQDLLAISTGGFAPSCERAVLISLSLSFPDYGPCGRCSALLCFLYCSSTFRFYNGPLSSLPFSSISSEK